MENSTDIKNIIFDLGGVIFDIDHRLSQSSFEALGFTNIASNFSHSGQSELFSHLETGGITPADFYQQLQSGRSVTTQELEKAFNDLLIGVPDASYFPLLSRLKNRYRTFLLSNNNRVHYNWIINYLQQAWRLPSLSQFFEAEYYSHLVGLRKPGKDIFQLLTDTESLNPQETLFIDDTPANIATASSMGIKVYLKAQEENLNDVIKRFSLLDYK